MNVVKRILAIIGIVILVGLYVTTLILAISGDESYTRWFTASIVATVVVPVMLYVYQWLYKLVKKQAEDGRSGPEIIYRNDDNNEIKEC